MDVWVIFSVNWNDEDGESWEPIKVLRHEPSEEEAKTISYEHEDIPLTATEEDLGDESSAWRFEVVKSVLVD